jgi:mRNA-degrading endonuclease toxin of MazEF toxin-antitoxin module
MNRGELVIIDFRSSVPKAGVRPALVVQNDRDNARMSNTFVVQVTTTIWRKFQDTQLLLDSNHADWLRCGLRQPSVVNCSNIYTVDQRDVAKKIGSLSEATMRAIDECLGNALGMA